MGAGVDGQTGAPAALRVVSASGDGTGTVQHR